MRTDFVIGIIRGPHGLSGKVKVESTSGEFEHFLNLTDVTLRKGEKAVKAAVECRNRNILPFYKIQGYRLPRRSKRVFFLAYCRTPKHGLSARFRRVLRGGLKRVRSAV